MLAKLLTIYTLEEEKSGIMKFLEGLKNEFLEALEDFSEFFIGIKEFLYDGSVEKFGEMPVNILLIGLGFLLIMLIFIKIVNR
ncbi:MAG: hypothetical protein ACI4WW_08780 [Candidatus Coprovivens sp.]